VTAVDSGSAAGPPLAAPMPTTLVLIPTDLERRRLAPRLASPAAGGIVIELCGFGPVAAAARAAGLIARHRPDRVLLAGIAGRLGDRLSIGRAYRFSEIACHGIGAGTGDGFQPAGAMGWPHWPGDLADPAAAISDVITLGPPPGSAPSAGRLLTACAASATADDVALRRRAFPTAVAEDMEGFGVALACALARTPVCIVRGISNAVGDRQRSNWNIPQALGSARRLALDALESPAWPFPDGRNA